MKYEKLKGLIEQEASEVLCSGLSGADRAFLLSRIYNDLKRPMFIVAASEKECGLLSEDLSFFSGGPDTPVTHFPTYHLPPFKHLSYHNAIAARRIGALYGLAGHDGPPPVMLASVESLLQRLIPKTVLADFAELIMAGEEIEPEALVEKLVAGGYSRTAIVEEPGDFCVRGGIMDIFSPQYDNPLRIELYGDMVDNLRFFSPHNQRKTADAEEAVILPARESILRKTDVIKVSAAIRKQAAAQNLPAKESRALLERLAEENTIPGMDGYLPLIYEQTDSIFDYLPETTVVVLVEPRDLAEKASGFEELILKSHAEAVSQEKLCVNPKDLFLSWREAETKARGLNPLTMSYLPVLRGGARPNQSPAVEFGSESNESIVESIKSGADTETPFAPLVEWISKNREQGIKTLFVSGTASRAERLRVLLTPYGISPEYVNRFENTMQKGRPEFMVPGTLSGGFSWPEMSLAAITDTEIFGRKFRRKKSGRKVQTDLLSLGELKQGDLIVHTDHGIGVYEGLTRLQLDSETGDFLLIKYQGTDRLYLPVDRMGVIQKYMGVEGIAPVIDKMGGKSWEKIKSKVKASVEEMAGELLNLYAERKVNAGHSYQMDEQGLLKFEEGFPYDETPDQIQAIEDVLADMAAGAPMDRLICGDVGYGKTEVALRASFVAVAEGRQTAVLVPTTVLAEQHYETFLSRYKSYPVTIACLNRFRSGKEQREILEGLKTGGVDIVIGTHRLIQKDVRFKDLGLLILDEEQRFGVKHKERLKKLRSTVDVLALTATPIPRTLHLSLMGIRDISVISTPPEHRRPIVTYISEFDKGVASQAIRQELDRNGQVFFVHNHVKSIYKMEELIAKLVPEARLGVAHGRQSEEELERTMLRFIKREIDVLICTTIIESGIDIPSANTILVNRADRFGLSQIYQLRGRVGRGEDQAYAYLFIPHDASLTKDARKRLKVLMEHSDLGSGFQIAMSDLKIRGGGAILGASQSGHIAAVGYDMFLQLMENAVNELKGEPVVETLEPEVHIPRTSLIPESYVPDIDQRLRIYRRLAKFNEIKEISDFKQELADRFGDPPPETANLLLKIMLKVLCAKALIKRLDLTDTTVTMFFSESHVQSREWLNSIAAIDPGRFKATSNFAVKAELSNGSPMMQCKNILKEIVRRVRL